MPPHANSFTNCFLEPIQIECMTPKTPATSWIHEYTPSHTTRSKTRTRTFSIPPTFDLSMFQVQDNSDHDDDALVILPEITPSKKKRSYLFQQTPSNNSSDSTTDDDDDNQKEQKKDETLSLPSLSAAVSSRHPQKWASPRRHSLFHTPCAKSMAPDAFFHANKFRPNSKIINMLESVDFKDLARQLADISSATDGWKNVGMKQGVQIYKKKNIVKGYVDIPAHHGITVGAVSDFIFDNNPQMYNDGVEFASRLYTHQKGETPAVVLYQSFHGAFGFPGRDFFLAASRCFMDEEENHAVFSCRSVVLPDVALPVLSSLMLSGRVRGECIIGGYDVRKLANGDVRVTAIWELDLKVSLPGFIMGNLQNQSLYHITPMVKQILSQSQQQRTKGDN